MKISDRSRSFTLSGWILIVAFVVAGLSGESCNAKVDHTKSCTSSSCGNIHNISYPFRLKHDPKHCGQSQNELSCENNMTVLYLPSGKYYLQQINYHNQTIRLVDPGLQQSNCINPRNLLPVPTSYNLFPYTIYDLHGSQPFLSTSVFFFKCAHPVNSSVFVSTAPCINTSPSTANSFIQPKTYSYVKVGDMELGDIDEGCSIETMALASFDHNSKYYASYTAIHNALMNGFELGYSSAVPESNNFLNYICPGKWSTHDKFFPQIQGFFRCLWEVIYAIVDYFAPGNLEYNDHYGWLPFSSIERGWILLISIGLIFPARFVLGAPFVIAFLIYKWRRRHLSMYSSIEDFLLSDQNCVPIRYSYSEIKKMSNRFKEKLGEGGFGTVFKGKLRSGRFVAIKMLSKPKANGQDFVSEVATIGRIHHVNVVQLVGYCVEGSKRALVYDFMPNGSLDRCIYSKEGSIPLSCKKMYEISLGVAQGIKYLHQGCEMQILHFDIKPHNILLDENFNPKISDFGLAKLYPVDNTIVSLTAARGTMGYMAPELFYKNIGGVSFKADVYSFGMLLMEMASRRKNLNALVEHSSQLYFPSWVYDQYCEGNELEMGEATEEEKKMIKKMVITALWCIQMKPCDRPSMNEAIEMLERDVEFLQMPQKPFLGPQEIPVGNLQDDLNAVCSAVELTCTLSAR